MKSAPPRLITVGVISERLGVPVHRVRHVLDTRPDIRPSAYAGRTRLYDQHALARVRHELAAIAARQYGGRADG